MDGSNVFVRRYTFDANHDEAALVAGVATFTPSPFDILLDAWIDVNESPWDGTTPMVDVAQDAFWTAQGHGLFHEWTGTAVDLSVPRIDLGGLMQHQSLPLRDASDAGVLGQRRVPSMFLSDEPLKLVVSQDGTKDTDVPGSTVGAFSLVVVVASPVDADFGHEIR